jgi:hypothetical protein
VACPQALPAMMSSRCSSSMKRSSSMPAAKTAAGRAVELIASTSLLSFARIADSVENSANVPAMILLSFLLPFWSLAR